MHTESIHDKSVNTVVLPIFERGEIFKLVHETPLARHSSETATVIEFPRQHTAKVKMEEGILRELHFNKLRPYGNKRWPNLFNL